MSIHQARIAGPQCLILALLCVSCARYVPLDSRIGQNPHLRSGSLEDEPAEANILPEQELEDIKRQIRKYCHFRHDLDPTRDIPSGGRISDKAYERCYQLKVRGRELQDALDRMQELAEEAAEEPESLPSPGTIRFGDGPLQRAK